MTFETELVVLLDADGIATGSRAKSDVHGSDTPLHLAFSCYLLDEAGRLLVTRRALSKRAWPGVWTNSFCGHPSPGEEMLDALARRARQELNVEIEAAECRLPDFRYRAVDAGGTVENEICPVFTAKLRGEVRPEPSEVVEFDWISPAHLLASLAAAPFAFSPWMRIQLPQLFDVGAFAEA